MSVEAGHKAFRVPLDKTQLLNFNDMLTIEPIRFWQVSVYNSYHRVLEMQGVL